MKLIIQKISLSEFDQLEQQVFDNDQTFDQMYDTWQSLDQFFHNASYETDAEFRLTYFRLYVRLTWKMLMAMDRKYFVDIVRRQILIVMISDVDVLKEIMWYLGFSIADRTTLESLYLELKKAFLESEAVIGEWQGKNVTVAELVKEIDSVYKTGDSLAQADFESRLRQIMFPGDEISKKYLTADPEQAREQFLDIVSFFETFTQENIWFVVDSFINPEKYQNVPAGAAPPAAPAKIVTPPKPPTPPAPKPTATPSAQPSQPSARPATPPQSVPKQEAKPRTEPSSGSGTGEPKLVVPPTIRPKPTLAQIKSQIESQFKKDADGNFIDIEGVMAKLGELAEKNNDLKIAEMIYFDEKENKFKWTI